MGDQPSLTLPDGYVARPPAWDDLGQVNAVIRDDQTAVHGEADTSEEDLRSDWRRPGFDPESHARVVVHDGRIVAYAEQVRGRGAVGVSPAHHGRGLGGALLDWTVAAARHQGLPQVGQTIPDANEAAVALARDRGFAVRWETWLFAIDLAGAHPHPGVAHGYRLRDLAKDADAREVHRVIEAAFSTWPDRDPPMPFEDWHASFFDRDDVTPRTSVVTETDAGEVVGVLIGLVEDGDGVVDQLAVTPPHQGRGLGVAMLREAFARYAEDGLERAYLSTDSRTGARPFYERAGMQVTRSFRRWTLPL